jgi:hypothetical protein
MIPRGRSSLDFKFRTPGLKRRKPVSGRLILGVIIAPALGPLSVAALAAVVIWINFASVVNAAALMLFVHATFSVALAYPLMLGIILPLYVRLSDKIFIRCRLCLLVGGGSGLVVSLIVQLLLYLSDWSPNPLTPVAGVMIGAATASVFWLIVLSDIRQMFSNLKSYL